MTPLFDTNNAYEIIGFHQQSDDSVNHIIRREQQSTCILYYLLSLGSTCTLANSGFLKNFLYQGGVKSTVSWVFEDLKLKISEGRIF